MRRIIYWFRHLKKLETVQQAQQMGLIHYTNVHGDGINLMNCRSIWVDEFDNPYRCGELLVDGKDLVMEAVKKEHPELFEN